MDENNSKDAILSKQKVVSLYNPGIYLLYLQIHSCLKLQQEEYITLSVID
jgi:hypothetical protein